MVLEMERDSQLLHTSATCGGTRLARCFMRSSLHAHYVHITHLQYGTKITQLELREAAEQRGVYEDLPELDVRRYYICKILC